MSSAAMTLTGQMAGIRTVCVGSDSPERAEALRDAVAEDDRPDIRASLDGDEEAFARLVSRYENQIAAQMWRFTRDAETLEELVQETFVEVYLSLRSYRERAPFLHWVRRIATRVGYRYWKRRERDRRRQKALATWQAEQPAEDPAAATTERRAATEAAAQLHRLLAALPPAERLVLTLHYFEECSMREIAARTGWSRTLVKVRAYRARRKLKALLEKSGFGEENHD